MQPRTAARLRAAARAPPDVPARRRSPSADPADDSDGGWGFSARLPSLARLQAETAASGRPSTSLDAGLADSAAARHPGAAGAMLAAFGGSPGATLTGLAGTAMADAVDPDALHALRARLRSSLDAAWAADAAARGDAAAAAGDGDRAAVLYEEAVRLDPACAGGWAGKGALAERARRMHDAADAYDAAGTPAAAAAAARCRGVLRSLGLPERREGLLRAEGGGGAPPPAAAGDGAAAHDAVDRRPPVDSVVDSHHRRRSRSRSRERHKRRREKGRR